MRHTLILLTTLRIALLSALPAADAASPEFVDVFVSGHDGYPNYRIPSLVLTSQSTLLALCEGRRLSFSTDEGETWSTCVEEKQLPEPRCQASLIRVHDGKDTALVFANPDSQNGRKNGTLRLSRDEGKTWPVSRLLVPGVFRYNSLARLADGTLLCLFEQGPAKTPMITLARFGVEWLVQTP